MVDLKILKEKIETVSTIIRVTKWIALIIIIVNAIGWYLDKVDLTIFLSVITAIAFWVWALDSQVGRMEKILKKKRIMEEMKNKKGTTEVGKWIIWILIGLAILYVLSKVI